MSKTLEKACLECTLPICDDRSKECAFVQITRKPAQERYQREREKRLVYQAEYKRTHPTIPRAERKRRNMAAFEQMIDAKTHAAVAEMVTVAFHAHGGVGPVGVEVRARGERIKEEG